MPIITSSTRTRFFRGLKRARDRPARPRCKQKDIIERGEKSGRERGRTRWNDERRAKTSENATPRRSFSAFLRSPRFVPPWRDQKLKPFIPRQCCYSFWLSQRDACYIMVSRPASHSAQTPCSLIEKTVTCCPTSERKNQIFRLFWRRVSNHWINPQTVAQTTPSTSLPPFLVFGLSVELRETALSSFFYPGWRVRFKATTDDRDDRRRNGFFVRR